MMRINKKGVSPLIATVLLIAFAVALGAVVMNWGRAYVEDTASFAQQKSDTEIKCTTDAKLDFLTINTVRKVCYNSTLKRVDFIIQNVGSAMISGLTMTAVSNDNVNPVLTINTSINLSRSNVYKGSINTSGWDPSYIDTVRIVPQIKIQGKDILCPKNELVEDTPLNC